MADDNKLDDLLKRAKAIEDKKKDDAEKAAAVKSVRTVPSAGEVVEELRTFNNTMAKIRNFYAGCKVIYNNFLQPVAHVIGKVVGPVYRGYKWLLEKTDHNLYEGKWEKKGAKFGRAVVMALTIAVGIQGIPASIGGDQIRYFTTEPVYDGVRMAAFYENKETLFLNYKQEVDPAHDVWSVSGCNTPTNCNTEDAVYFRVKNSLMHNFWSAAVKGTSAPVFISDQVVAPIAPGVSKCEVTSYGARWRVAKWLQAYPYMLDAQCTSVTANEAFGEAAAKKDTAAPVVQQQAPVKAPILRN